MKYVQDKLGIAFSKKFMTNKLPQRDEKQNRVMVETC